MQTREEIVKVGGVDVHTWIGGTGKYEGLRGEFNITTSGNLAADGIIQTAGRKDGSYRIGK